MNYLQMQFYSKCSTEFNDFQTSNLDVTDCAVPSGLLSGSSCRGFLGAYENIMDCPEFQVGPYSRYTVHSFEFNFVNNFWSCFLQNGASGCGRQIRQGLAHLVDKTQFVDDELSGRGSPIDCFAPPVQNVPCNGSGWNPCSWDTLYPSKYNSCISGYNFASESFGTLGVQKGTPDFCAAADHFLAAGIGTSKDSNCVLQGLSGAAATDTLNLYYDNNSPDLTNMANLLANSVNTLMNRSGAVSLCPGAGDGAVLGADTHDFTNLEPQMPDNPISSVPQYPDDPPGKLDNLNPCNTWHMATVTWSLDASYDQFYLVYNSNFTHKFGYYWNTTVDSWTSQIKYGPDRTAALRAAEYAELYLGSDVASIPVYAGLDTMAYRSSLSNVINRAVGVGPPGWWTALNAVSSSPSGSDTIRWGMSHTTDTLNIFNIGTSSEAFVLGEIYDSLLIEDPANPLAQIGSLASGYTIDYYSSAIYFTLRGDVYWHDGVQFTANDVKFSILAARNTTPPSPFQGLAEQVRDVTVTSPTNLAVYFNQMSPFDLWEVGEMPIIPQHIWASVNPDGSYAFTADPQKTTLSFDPVTNFALVGTGPYVCRSVWSDHSQGKPGGYCTMTASGQSGGGNVGIGGTILLERFGHGGTHGLSDQYFRSTFNLAQWAWSDVDRDLTINIQDLASAQSCIGQNVNANPQCAQFDAVVPVNNLVTGTNDGANSCTSGGTYCVGGNGDGTVEQSETDKVSRWFGNAPNWLGAQATWDPTILPNIATFPITGYEGPSEQYVAQFTSPAPDFTLSSTWVTAPAGTTGTASITVTAINGFTGTVSLTANPTANLSCGLVSPSSVTKSGTAGISCSSTVSGTYSVTVTGTSGALSRSTSLMFTITDFTISAVSPNAVDVGVSSPSSSCTICYIYVSALNGFTGTVSLTDVVPPNLQCGQIIPSTVSSFNSNSYATASLSCTSTLAGNYNVTITGTSGSLTHTTIMTFTFQDFSLTTNFSPVMIPVGSENPAFFNLRSLPNPATTIYSQMFSDTVTLAATPSSSSVVCWFDGASNTTGRILQGGQSYLVSMTCTGSTAGSYVVSVTGSSSSGPLIHSTSVIVNITDFTISGSTVLFIAGNQRNVPVILSTLFGFPGYGFTGNVNLTISAPTAINAVCPSSVTLTGVSTTVQCSVSPSTPGRYAMTVTGNYKCNFCYYNAQITHVATINVNAVPSYINTSSTNTFSPSNGTTYSVSVAGALTVDTTAMNLTGTLSVTTKDGTGRILHSGLSNVKIPFNANGIATFSVETPASSAWLILSGCTIDIPLGTQSCVALTWSPDVNQDGRVDILDLSAVGGAFGSTSGSQNWNPRADINGDGKVDILDLSTVGSAFGADYRPMFVDPGLASYTAPNTLSVAIGSASSSTIIYTSTNNFSGNVSIAVAISPAGPSCTVSQSNISLSPGGNVPATLLCYVPLATTVGRYTIAVTGTAGSEMDTVLVTLQVTDFTITTSLPSLTTKAGASVWDNVTLSGVNGFTDSVGLTLTLSPSGLSCSISPSTGVPALVAALSCNGSAGVYTVTVTGADGQLMHSASVTVTVQDFTLSASKNSVTIRAGQAGTTAITASSVDGFAGSVGLFSNVAPSSGLTCVLSPTSISLGASGTSILSCTGSAGWYSVNVTGTVGALSHVVEIAYTITDYSVTAAPTSIAIIAGSSGNSTITVSSSYGFTGTVLLSFSVSPTSGLTCSLSPTSVTLTAPQIQVNSVGSPLLGSVGTLTYGPFLRHGGSVSPNSGSVGFSNLSCHGSAGVYSVTVTGASNPLSHFTSITYSIQDFSIAASSTSISIAHGTSSSVTITLASLSGFAGNVTLSVSISPIANHGPTASLSSSKVYICSPTPGASTLNISTVSTTPKQQYTVTVTATSGSLTHTILISLTVT